MSAPWRRLCSAWMVSLSCHHRQLLLHRSVGLDRISSQVRGTEDSGRWSPTPPKLQKTHLQQQSSCVLYHMLSRMCVLFSKKTIFRFKHLYCWTTCVCVRASPIPGSAGVCLLFFHHRGSSTNVIRCKDVGLFEGDSQIVLFFYMVLYEEKKEACSIHKSNI